MDSAQFSRSAHTCPYGPLDEGTKVRLPTAIRDEIRRRAAALDMPSGEWMRDVLIAAVVGQEEAERVAVGRLRAVLGTVPEKAPE